MSRRITVAKSPWSLGPGEILQHGLALLRKDSDTNRRLAMLSIDNAVELMIKTYLGLPKRVTGLNISRAKYAEFSESFPKLLDAMDEFASDKAAGINLGEIEWYHRLRNELYHHGNGLTVELEKVQVYAALAQVLFKNLFGNELEEQDHDEHEKLLGGFLSAWSKWDQVFGSLRSRLYPGQEQLPLLSSSELVERGLITTKLSEAIGRLRRLRNGVVHGEKQVIDKLNSRDIDEIKFVTAKLEEVLKQMGQS
jgi:hypothetical protein